MYCPVDSLFWASGDAFFEICFSKRKPNIEKGSEVKQVLLI